MKKIITIVLALAFILTSTISVFAIEMFSKNLNIGKIMYVSAIYKRDNNHEHLRAMTKAVMNGEESFYVGDIKFSEIYNIKELSSKYNPYDSYIAGINYSSGYINIEYHISPQEIKRQVEYSERAAADMIEGMEGEGEDIDKVASAYLEVLGNAHYPKNIDTENYEYVSDYHTPYGFFAEGEVVCEGYAKALQLLLNKLGIQNQYVSGYYGNVKHGWNLVMLEGEWYHMDSTWSDMNRDIDYFSFYPSRVMLDRVRGLDINFTFFLKLDSDMKKTHIWNVDDYFTSSITPYSAFRIYELMTANRTNLVEDIGSASNDYKQIRSILNEKIINGAESVMFIADGGVEFADIETIQRAVLDIIRDKNITTVRQFRVDFTQLSELFIYNIVFM